MTTPATKTYLVGVIERAIAYYRVEAEDARTAAENWQDGEFYARDDEALDSEGPSNVRERQPDGKWRIVPPSEWEETAEISRFDDYEIHGVREYHGAPFGQGKYSEQVPDDEAQFWSLFGHIPGQGLDCIGDFKTRQHAEEIYARITGRPYGSQS
jgi:hypothetical protein